MSSSGTTNNPVPWTQEEDAELMRLRSLGKTWGQCAKKLGTRTPGACASRATTLKSSAKRVSKKASFWTKDEDDLLAKLWPTLSVAQISERMGRTLKGVYRRANRLGLTCGQPQAKKAWTPEDDAVLKANLGTMTYAEIGVLLNRTDKSVKARALHLSLRGGAKPRLPKQKDHMRKCHDCGRPTPDYRCPACWRKLRKRLGCPVEEEPTND